MKQQRNLHPIQELASGQREALDVDMEESHRRMVGKLLHRNHIGEKNLEHVKNYAGDVLAQVRRAVEAELGSTPLAHHTRARLSSIFGTARKYLEQSAYLDRKLVSSSVPHIEPVARVLGTRTVSYESDSGKQVTEEVTDVCYDIPLEAQVQRAVHLNPDVLLDILASPDQPHEPGVWADIRHGSVWQQSSVRLGDGTDRNITWIH